MDLCPQNEGMIGLDWSLNVGGVITRSVHGVPDEGGDSMCWVYYLPLKSNVYTIPSHLILKSKAHQFGY